MTLSGRGDKDVAQVRDLLGDRLGAWPSGCHSGRAHGTLESHCGLLETPAGNYSSPT